MSNPTSQWRYIWTIGVTFFVGVCIAAILIGLLHRRFHPENQTAIQPGMTLKQVEDLLGGPPGDYGWYWFGSSMMTEKGVVVPPGSTEMVWFNDDQRIEVHFDNQSRVVAVHQIGRLKMELEWLKKKVAPYG
jgi:hypothetical protein